MAETSLGTAYVQIIPSAKGIGSSLSNELGIASESAGASAGTKGGASLAKTLVKAVIAAGVGKALSSSITAGMNFDKAMSQVAATLGKTMDQLNSEVATSNSRFGEFEGTLTEFAQVMGAKTAFSASQAAEALNYMALAGYNTQQSMDMLPSVLDLAAAGSMDLAKASDMVTDTQTAFGMTFERTNQLVDEMAKAASTGNTSVEQLGDAFLTVGGLAAELNGGFVTLKDGTDAEVDGIQELSIALTAMANAGIKGSEAGTHMRNMLLKLSSPTSDGTKQLEALGVQVFDTEGNMRSLSDVFGDLDGALGTLTQQEKIQAISDLFNTRDLASAEALLNAVGEDWDEIGAAILDAEGAASAMAETQLDNLAGDMTIFKSALEGAQIAISDGLAPTLRTFVQQGTSMLSNFTTNIREKGFGSALVSLVDEIGQAASDIVVRLVQGIAKKLPEIANIAISMVQTLAGGIVDAIPALIEAVPPLIQSLLTGIKDLLPVLLTAGLDIIKGLAFGILENLGEMVDVAMSIILELVDGLLDALPELLTFITEAIVKVIQNIAENAPTIINTVYDIAAKILTTLIENMDLILAAVAQILVALVKAIVTIDWLGIIKKILTSLKTVMETALSKWWEMVKNAIKNIVESFKNTDWAKVGSDAMTFLLNAIMKVLNALFVDFPKKLAEIATNGITAVRNIDWGSLGRNIIDGIVNGLARFGSAIKNMLIELAQGAFNAVKSFFGIHSPSTLMRDEIGKNIALGMAYGVEDEGAAVSKALDDIAMDSVHSINANLNMNTSGTGFNAGTTFNNAFTLNAAPGMDIEYLAQRVSQIIMLNARVEGAAYG